jgi:hypothetical protein
MMWTEMKVPMSLAATYEWTLREDPCACLAPNRPSTETDGRKLTKVDARDLARELSLRTRPRADAKNVDLIVYATSCSDSWRTPSRPPGGGSRSSWMCARTRTAGCSGTSRIVAMGAMTSAPRQVTRVRSSRATAECSTSSRRQAWAPRSACGSLLPARCLRYSTAEARAQSASTTGARSRRWHFPRP